MIQMLHPIPTIHDVQSALLNGQNTNIIYYMNESERIRCINTIDTILWLNLTT